jgi:integral membrane protein
MTSTDRVIVGFRISAIAEAISWTGLLIGMLFKYVLSDNETGVHVFGPIHGVVFLVYLAMTIAVGVVCRWRWTTIALGLAAGIPPFATYAFEVWALRSGRLRRRTREKTPA